MVVPGCSSFKQGGKPIISFIIDQLVEVGIRDFVFVIGYLGEKIKNFLEIRYPDLNKEFVVQEERLGSAHAIWTARKLIQSAEEVVIFFGDVIVDMDFRKVLESPFSMLGVKKVSNPREFGVVEYGHNDILERVVEKPRIPKSDMAMVGFYKIREVKELLDALDFNINNKISSTGEYPLTDALMRMIENGVKFKTITVDNWFNCGKKEVLLETNAILLDREGYSSHDNDLPAFDNAIIIHPVSIGADCNISNSIIGPHVTIGNNVTIHFSVVRDSIIGNFASINEIILQKSVVGNDAAITGMRQSLNIGDNTEIDFSLPT